MKPQEQSKVGADDGNRGKPPLTPADWIKLFNDALQAYETDHPHWHLEVLVSMIKWGLRSLGHYIEDRKDRKITWDSPFVELHYPVEWDWNSRREGDMVHGKQIVGNLTKENTANVETATKMLSEMMAAHFNVAALGNFTNGAWFEQRRKSFVPYLPVELDAMLKQIEDRRQRHAMAEELFRPFSIGTTRVDITDLKPSKKPLPPRVAKRLQDDLDKMDISGVSFDVEISGRKLWAGLIFEIQPLVINRTQRRAYFPITVGLAFNHKFIRNKLTAETPSAWPQKDRETFWKELIEAIDKLAEQLIPKNERKASIIIATNDGLQIERTISNPEQIDAAIAWATSLGEGNSARPIVNPTHQQLLRAMEAATTPNEKGQALESLVAVLFGSVAGFAIESRRLHTATEEIDLVITNGSNDPIFRREEGFILVECKNWSSKCGKNEFVELRAKMENRKTRCSLGFLVSWNGYADTITKEMLRGSHERMLIVPISGDQIRVAIRENAFQDLIRREAGSAITT